MASVFDYVLKNRNTAHLFKTGSEGVSPSAATRSHTLAAAVRRDALTPGMQKPRVYQLIIFAVKHRGLKNYC